MRTTTVKRMAYPSMAIMVAGFALIVAASPALAQTAAAQPAPTSATSTASSTSPYGPWQVDLTGFGWAPSSNGTITLRGTKAPADARFLQILKKSDSLFAYMSHIEVHNDDFGAFFEPIYMNLGFKSPAGLFKSDVKTSLLYLQFGGFYRLARGTFGAPEEQAGWSIDAIAAARYTQLDASASFANSGFDPSGGHHWVEPLIGLRARVSLSSRIELSARGDVGGFGAGSEFAWDAEALAGYKFALFDRAATVFGGWRALAQDYKTGSGRSEFGWNTILNGPVFGLNVHF